MQRAFTFVLLLIVCFVTLAVPILAQEDTALVRIGYFAFDPREYDTFIDGELAPFNDGWNHFGWWEPIPAPQIVCCTATPFMEMEAGTHTLSFAPKGEGLAEAIAEPFEVTLAPGHAHSLAVIGEPDDGSLNVLAIDETDEAANVDTANNFLGFIVHDIASTPPVTLQDDFGLALEPGQHAMDSQADAGTGIAHIFASWNGINDVLYAFDTVPLPPGISDLTVMSGTYPGSWGQEFVWAWNWGYSGARTVTDGGQITPGEPKSGGVSELANRVQYRLSLDEDTALNFTAHGTGRTTDIRPGMSSVSFDPELYIFDDEGRMLYWNDDLDWFDRGTVALDAGYKDLVLPAGEYILEVGGSLDSMAGPFELTVEPAQE